jgi:hypothetical protein
MPIVPLRFMFHYQNPQPTNTGPGLQPPADGELKPPPDPAKTRPFVFNTFTGVNM